jgi:hypothetical protein
MKMEWNRICEREQESIFHPAMQAASFYGFQLHYALYQNGIHRMFRNCSVLIMLRKMIQMIIDHLCFLRIVGSDPM